MNFVLLDVARPEIATLVSAMLRARDAVTGRAFAHK
jgi:hypothetical protein